MGRRVYRLTLAYDGTRYHGWQRLDRTEQTIQGKVEAVLSRIFDEPIEISGSGRTDAGVHALAQVASFHAPEHDPQKILKQLREYLPEDIGALDLSFAEERFHARLCAVEKTYVYRIWNSELPDVFERRYRTQIREKLDPEAMREAARQLTGIHDFRAFCSNKHYKKSTVRNLKQIRIIEEGNEIRIEMTADGFLYNMARILAGTMIEVGSGRRNPDTIPEIFASGIRMEAGETAAAKGLCLKEVIY